MSFSKESFLDQSRNSSIDDGMFRIDYNNISDADESDACQNFSSEELFKKFQEYLKKNGSKHSSPESLSGCKSDFFLEHQLKSSSPESSRDYLDRDIQRLLACNKKYQKKTEDLQIKNEQLQRNNEVEEEKSEELKKQIGILEKELRCCHQDRNYLENEMEQMQLELYSTQDDKLKAENQNKKIKKEEEELRQTIQNQLDQIENLSRDVCSLNVTNKNLFEENISLKGRCESLEVDVEMKVKDLEQKLQLYQVMREQVEEYKTSVQNLQEENEVLLNQLHEIQIESSVFQPSYKSDAATYSRQSTRQRGAYSLQSEIAEAEQVGYGKYSPSSSSPYSSVTSTPSRSLLNLSNVSQQAPKLMESTTQTMKLSGGDGWSSQLGEDDCQQNRIDKSKHASVESECELESMPDKLVVLEKELERMSDVTSQHTAREDYLKGQLGMKQNKIRELVAVNQKHVSEISLLSDIIQKLGRSKLEAWFDEADKLRTSNAGYFAVDEQHIRPLDSHSSLDEKFSPLIEALSLESLALPPRPSINIHSIEDIPECVQHFICNAGEVVKQGKMSLETRLKILNKTKAVVEEAIIKKLEGVKDLLKDIHSYLSLETSQSNEERLQQTVTISRDVNDLLSSVVDLMRRYGACFQPIGALETEQRYTAVVEVFVRHFEKLSQKPLMGNKIVEISSSADGDDFNGLNTDQPPVWPSVSTLDWSVDEVTSSLYNSVARPRNKSKWIKPQTTGVLTCRGTYHYAPSYFCGLYLLLCLANGLQGRPSVLTVALQQFISFLNNMENNQNGEGYHGETPANPCFSRDNGRKTNVVMENNQTWSNLLPFVYYLRNNKVTSYFFYS